MLLRVLDPAGEVVDEDELYEGGVDEEHADPVPEVHGGQVGDHWQLGAEPGYMSQMLYAGQSAGPSVTFLSDF